MKYVLTGGPCCGKTATINELSSRGFNVVEETARKIIKENPGITVEERQKRIFEEQLEKELKLSPDGLYFLDRSLVDCVAYSLFYIGKLPELLHGFDFRRRYDKIFLLHRLQFEKDNIRVENAQEAQLLHDKLHEVYISLGYAVAEVPLLPVAARANFILERIAQTPA
jgi:predicted ATPase